ncbi:zinc finger protein 26-like [Protopterus annectens]|uniref:zinc finger protein 26-like n=1 Tax=Protopterus annectens TaxID=7888 RepID=UPI001CF9A74F|nr:zinc finger protein 26-like [Protopterus annectens]
MVGKSQRLKLGHTTQESDCKEKNLYATNGETEQRCGDHGRRLELFCQEDEAFICVLCVPKHSSHSFIFLQDVISVYKEKMKAVLTSLESNVKDFKYLQSQQEKEILSIQDAALSLEQYIRQEFAKLHQFLQDKEQNLIQQVKEKEANILKETKESLQSVKQDIISFPVVEPDSDLKLKNKVTEVDILEKMVQHVESTEKDVMATQKTCDSNLELGQQEFVRILRVPRSFEDVAVIFSEEEWKLLKTEDKELHKEVMLQNYDNMVSIGYRIPKKKLSLVFKADDEPPKSVLKRKNTTEQKDNLRDNRKRCKIPQKTLPLQFKADELPTSDSKRRNTTEQKDNIHDNFQSTGSSECSVSCRQQSSLERPQLHYPTERLQVCDQPVKVGDQFHLTPVPQFQLGHCNRNPECDKGTPQLLQTENLQQCTQAETVYNKFHRSPVSYLYSGNNCNETSECDTGQIFHKEKKLYKCTECNKSFVCAKSLKSHQALHTEKNGIHSNHGIRNPKELEKLNEKKSFKCAECNKSFRYLFNFQIHFASHTGERLYKCAECSKSFTDPNHLRLHLVCHNRIRPYKCAYCSKSYNFHRYLREHLETHTGIKPYKCAECGKCFTIERDLTRHQYSHTDIRPFKCSECEKCFRQKVELIHHQRSHTGLKPFKCAECGKCFTQKSSLKCHQYSHAGIRPFKCTECDKSFTQKKQLKYHQNTHTGNKPYKCAECSRSFTYPSNLKSHLAIHTRTITEVKKKEKAYRCVECDKCFSRNRSLICHQYSHAGIKPYKCAECEKCFTKKEKLKDHQNTHLGKKPYKCPKCGKCFNSSSSFHRHKKSCQKI